MTAIDAFPQLAAVANETSADEKYLGHEFVTYSGWQEWADGYTPAEAREATLAHLRGWMFQSASLTRHSLRSAYVMGALGRRSATTLRTQWSHAAARGPKWARADLGRVWDRQMRPALEERLRDVSMLGGSVIHIHWIDDVKAGVRRPVLKRWPHEAIYWRSESPGYPGGYYAITSDSGLARIVPGDGHWAFVAHGERWHEFGAILAIGNLFVAGVHAERDEAGLSEAAGRASPWVEMPLGIPIGGPVDTSDPLAVANASIGAAVQKMIAGLGRARTGAAVPNGTKIEAFQITSDTQFFDRYSLRQLIKINAAILGIPTPGPGTATTYTPIMGWSVDEALVDKDHEALVRAWDDGVARPFCDLNGIDSDVHLIGERYASPVDRAEAEAKRAEAEARRTKAEASGKTAASLALAVQVRAWRDAGLAPTQAQVDAAAVGLGTPSIPLGAAPIVPAAAPPEIAPGAEAATGRGASQREV